jgi:hypothetical protein
MSTVCNITQASVNRYAFVGEALWNVALLRVHLIFANILSPFLEVTVDELLYAPHIVLVTFHPVGATESDAAVTVPVAFALTRVPLGLPALSVSIRTLRLTDGLPVLARLSFIVLAALPLPKTGKETLVFAVKSPIFCSEVACAVVGAFSMKTTLPAERVSQAG